MHWACAKITASPSTPDSHLLEILLDKLQLCKGISYAAVATHADNCGRRKLAAMLVEHEPRSTKQVCLSKMTTFRWSSLCRSKRHSCFRGNNLCKNLVSHVS
jgi:hypothetical protein